MRGHATPSASRLAGLVVVGGEGTSGNEQTGPPSHNQVRLAIKALTLPPPPRSCIQLKIGVLILCVLQVLIPPHHQTPTPAPTLPVAHRQGRPSSMKPRMRASFGVRGPDVCRLCRCSPRGS